ncbi:MAG: hypothetical protein V1862_14355 [Methanobacteriota archaeon]
MALKPLAEAINLLKNPILWIPGLYAGIIITTSLWLVFSGGEFIAGKLLFLGAVLFPFFVAGALGCMSSKDYGYETFFRSAVRFFFPVLLPVIVIIAVIILLLILFSIPFAIAGFGNDPALIGGLFIGITVPVIFFGFFTDNAAVYEGLKVFAALKRSMIIASRSGMKTISCIVISGVGAGALAMIATMIWSIVLADRFTQYLDMGMAEQQEIFSKFGLSDWQNILGPDGVAITATMVGLYAMILISILIAYKQKCYESIQTESLETEMIPSSGEYDEKGRWYKY